MEATKQAERNDFPDEVAAVSSSTVSAERVYGALADLNRHALWGGSMHKKKNFGLTSVDAPAGAATVGTEFRCTGVDPGGTFSDHSVVTEATRPSVFEFVTDAHLTPKKAGKPDGEATFTHRYEIVESAEGCTVSYRGHEVRWTNAPRMMTSKVLRPLVQVAINGYAKRTLNNLIASADQR